MAEQWTCNLENIFWCECNFFLPFCVVADVAIDILDELDLTHLRATGLQSTEEELPEAEQAPPGI